MTENKDFEVGVDGSIKMFGAIVTDMIKDVENGASSTVHEGTYNGTMTIKIIVEEILDD